MTNRNFLVFDRLKIKANNKEDLIRALELSTNLSENILLRKIVVSNNPEDPKINGKLFIAVIKEPSSGFWVFNIQNTLRNIKNLIGIESMAHLTCVGHDQQEIRSVLESLKGKNIDNILNGF